NKTPDDLTSPLTLANFNPGTSAQVFRYSGTDLTRIVRQADVTIAGRAINTTYPGNSITMLVIPPAGGTTGLSASPTTVATGTATTVSWSNIANPMQYDWIGLYPSSSTPDTAHIAYRYTGGGGSGSLSFMVPASAAAGTTYEFRLFANNGVSRLGTSGPITVTR